MNRVKVAEIYLDEDEGYGLLKIMPEYRTLDGGNWLVISDALQALDEGVAAVYAASLNRNRKDYAKVVKVVAKPFWDKQDRAFIDQLLGVEAPLVGEVLA